MNLWNHNQCCGSVRICNFFRIPNCKKNLYPCSTTENLNFLIQICSKTCFAFLSLIPIPLSPVYVIICLIKNYQNKIYMKKDPGTASLRSISRTATKCQNSVLLFQSWRFTTAKYRSDLLRLVELLYHRGKNSGLLRSRNQWSKHYFVEPK